MTLPNPGMPASSAKRVVGISVWLARRHRPPPPPPPPVDHRHTTPGPPGFAIIGHHLDLRQIANPVKLLVGVSLQADRQRNQDNHRRCADHHPHRSQRHARLAPPQVFEIKKTRSKKLIVQPNLTCKLSLGANFDAGMGHPAARLAGTRPAASRPALGAQPAVQSEQARTKRQAFCQNVSGCSHRESPRRHRSAFARERLRYDHLLHVHRQRAADHLRLVEIICVIDGDVSSSGPGWSGITVVSSV